MDKRNLLRLNRALMYRLREYNAVSSTSSFPRLTSIESHVRSDFHAALALCRASDPSRILTFRGFSRAVESGGAGILKTCGEKVTWKCGVVTMS